MLNEITQQGTSHSVEMGRRGLKRVVQIEAVVDTIEEETEEDVDQEPDGDPAESVVPHLGETEVDSESEEDEDVRDEDETRIDRVVLDINILQISLSVADTVGRLDIFVFYSRAGLVSLDEGHTEVPVADVLRHGDVLVPVEDPELTTGGDGEPLHVVKSLS